MDSGRHQDDLEEEVIHRTIPSWSQLRTVLKYAWTGWAIKLQSLKQSTLKGDPLFWYQAFLVVACAMVGWAFVTGRFAKGVQRAFWYMGLVEGTEFTWKSTMGDNAAVFSIQGRRPNMEDRYVMIDIPNTRGHPSTKLYSVMDGHGGDFSAIFVKKHLTRGLIDKIKVLQILQDANSSVQSRAKRFYEITKIKNAPIDVLKNIGISLEEYHLSIGHTTPPPKSQESGEGHVVLSSRVKDLDPQIPTVTGPNQNNNDIKEGEDCNVVGGEMPYNYLDNDMLSPYSNPHNPRSYNAKKGGRFPNNSNSNPQEPRITDYLLNNDNIDYPSLIRDEVARVDTKLLAAAKSRRPMHVGGTTLLLAIHDEVNAVLWVANVGDSRGVMRSSGPEEVLPLSYDHKPNQIKERKRIEEAGGFVAMNGVWRVQGILATSRAMGDFPLKKVVTSEPDILSFDTSAKGGADFAILATDGLWDTHTNDAAVNIVRNSLSTLKGKEKITSNDLLEAAKELTLDAFDRGSTDNISVILIKF